MFKVYVHMYMHALICIGTCAYDCVCVHICTHVEVRGQHSHIIFHHVGPRDLTQVVWLRDRCLYPRSHLTSPQAPFLRTDLREVKKVG